MVEWVCGVASMEELTVLGLVLVVLIEKFSARPDYEGSKKFQAIFYRNVKSF
jgi:hypothetical protein